MSIIKKFKAFLSKHSDEVKVAGKAIAIIADGLALSSKDRAIVLAAGKTLVSAGDNIADSLKDMNKLADELPKVADVIKSADFKKALEDAVSKAIAQMAKDNAATITQAVTAAVAATAKAP